MPDAWIQPSRQTVPDHRACGRCRRTYRRPLGVGWVAARRPRPAWVCPACTRETEMEPGDPVPPLEDWFDCPAAHLWLVGGRTSGAGA